MRREYAKFAGWAGLVLLAATGITYSVRNVADLGLWLPLGLGVALAIFWLAEFRAEALEVVVSRRARQGGQSLIYVLAVVAIVVLLQALAVNNDHSLDLTKEKTFTLADETVKEVRGLGQKVQFLAFYTEPDRGAFEDLLKRVKQLNPAKVDFEFINPNKEPLRAQEYGIHGSATTVLVAGDKKETLTGTREEDVLNALVKLGTGETKQVYFLAGHQEAAIDDMQPRGASDLKKGLENASFGVLSLNFATGKGEVPEDAAAVVIAGPQTDLLAPEVDALNRYLGRGGRLLADVDPRMQVPNLKAWLEKAGVVLDEDVAIDFNLYNQLAGGNPVALIIQNFDAGSSVTKDLAEQHGQAVFFQARTVGIGKLPQDATSTVLAHSMPTAFGWTGSGNRPPKEAGPHDKKGPLDLMVEVEAPLKDFGGDAQAPADKKARLVVMGSRALMENRGVVAFNNQDLIVNSLRWLADEEKKISLAPKPKENEPLMMDEARQRMIWWSIVLLALGAACAGFFVTLSRKRAA